MIVQLDSEKALTKNSQPIPFDIPGVIMEVPSFREDRVLLPGREAVPSPAFRKRRAFMPGKKPVLSPAAVLNKRKTPVKHFKKLNGDRGILQTLKIIKVLVEGFKKDIRIRELAGDIVRPFRSNKNKIKALFRWIKKNIKYVRDVDGIETLHTPYKILRQGYGDCDDLALLSASMLKAVGYKVYYVVTSNRPDRKFNHIFLRASDGRRKYVFDATINKFNKSRPGVTRKKVFV